MYKVKIPLFLRGMEGLVAGLTRYVNDGGGKKDKTRGKEKIVW